MYFRMFSLFVGAILLSTTTDVVQGRYVFRRNIHGWLQAHKVIATWEEAQQHCHSEGAVLASPIREILLEVMKSVMTVNHHNTSYFIGTKMREHAGPYMSEEEYTYEPSTGSCYKKHTDRRSWDHAEATCIAEGGHLVVINDSHEALVINNMGISDNHMYIGVRFNETLDDYISVHGDRLEQIYNVKRPTCGRAGCLVITTYSAQLYNFGCEIEREFICEKDPDNVRLPSHVE